MPASETFTALSTPPEKTRAPSRLAAEDRSDPLLAAPDAMACSHRQLAAPPVAAALRRRRHTVAHRLNPAAAAAAAALLEDPAAGAAVAAAAPRRKGHAGAHS